MIARHWRGWTTLKNADAYEALLNSTGQILRAPDGGEMEFVVIDYFESLEAVKCFAGEDYSAPAFEPEARQ
ncbi:MAG TPA: hypothetical protein VKT72_02565 [Candidatus Baltobacteraceae bacterium]|nr:hypothetical protein [Candidatus Baltobacteraceae bacterium]